MVIGRKLLKKFYLNFSIFKGFKLVLITNQKGVSTGQIKKEDLKTKIEAIIRHLNLPFQVTRNKLLFLQAKYFH